MKAVIAKRASGVMRGSCVMVDVAAIHVSSQGARDVSAKTRVNVIPRPTVARKVTIRPVEYAPVKRSAIVT